MPQLTKRKAPVGNTPVNAKTIQPQAPTQEDLKEFFTAEHDCPMFANVGFHDKMTDSSKSRMRGFR